MVIFFFRFWLQYTGVHGTKKKFSITLSLPKKILFLCTVLLDETWKISIDSRPLPEKKEFLTTLLLWCMGLRKNVIRLDPCPKKNSGYKTTMVHGTQKKLNWQSIPTEKNIHVHFRLQYYYDVCDFRKINLRAPSLKKYIYLVSDYSTTVEHRTVKNFNRHSTPPKKKLFLATVSIATRDV